jgi:hypothetical protein
MLAATETDFEANDFCRRIEQVSEIKRAWPTDVERKPRQQMFDQVGLVDTELVALAPAEEGTVRVIGCAIVWRWFVIDGIAGYGTHRSV